MVGYEPKGKIEPDPDAPRHRCTHPDGFPHSCGCSLGVDHSLEDWVKNHPGPADTAGE